MEIFDRNSKFLTLALDQTTDISKINANLIKDIVFVDSKNYKYNPSITRIYYISPEYSHANVISMLEELEQQRSNLENPSFIDGFYSYLSKEYGAPKELIDDMVDLVKEKPNKQQILNRLMESYDVIKKNVENYFRLLPEAVAVGVGSSGEKSWTATSYSSKASSVTSPVTDSSLEDIFETLTKKPEAQEAIKDEQFFIYIRYAYIVLAKKNPLVSEDYIEIFKNFKLDSSFLAVGMQLEGVSKFRIAKTDDKVIKKKIRIFSYSEHRISQLKTLIANTLYFLYNIDKDMTIYGELRQDASIVLKVSFSDKYELKDVEQIENTINIHSFKIIERFRSLVKNIIENVERTLVRISVKMVHRKGKIDKQILKNVFLTNFKETHKGTVYRFDLDLNQDVRLKEIIYSEKDGYSNFSIKNIPNKAYIPDIIKKLSYPFRGDTEIKQEIKLVKKKDIKDLKSLGIPYDARKCQKDRRIDILREEDNYPSDRVFNYKGNMLVCKNEDYPYPGETKTGIPCCFKKIQVKKQYKIQKSIDILRTMNVRPLMEEKNELVLFRREGVKNILLQDIFPITEGFYALTLSETKIGIIEIFNMLYGEGIQKEAFANLSTEDKVYLDIKDETDIQDITKAVSFYKKVNFLVLSYTDKDFSFVCSMSKYMLFDVFIIILFYNDNYKILVKSDQNTQKFGFMFSKSNTNIQRLIKSYNASCLSIKDCSYTVPDLKKLVMDGAVSVKYGIIDPVTNMIIYAETDKGLLPVKPSDIIYSVQTKFLKDAVKLDYNTQVKLLAEIGKTYEYLQVVGKVYDEKRQNVTGIKTVCDFVVPVSQMKEEAPSQSEDIFDINIADILKQDIMSGQELEDFNVNFLENYKNIVSNTIKLYYNENEELKNIIIKFTEEGDFEELLQYLTKLFVVKDKVEIPVENKTTIPIPIQQKDLVEILTYITWILMNNAEQFFTEDIVENRTKVDVSLIPNFEEIEISPEDL
jgi:hypothetical protein